MYTTHDIAKAMGRPIRTVLAAILRLGYAKTGRDYYLTDQQREAIREEMHDGPGRPRVRRSPDRPRGSGTRP